jgi:RNA polymerase sigma factor (sigma-70 family)
MTEEEEFKKIIEHFAPLINSLLTKYKSLLFVEFNDVKQEIYIKLLLILRRKKNMPKEELYPYLNVCIKNVIMDVIRENKREKLNIVYMDTIQIRQHNNYIGEPLQDLFKGFNEKEQQIACLYMDGLYQSEIGRILNVSQQTVSNKLKTIRTKIIENM